MDTVLFFGFAAAYIVLLVWGCVLAARSGWLTPANLPLLVVAGLIYDNTVIALGRYIGEGPLLESLSLARFWIHALVTPLLVVWAWHAIRRTGAGWAGSRAAAWVAVLIAAGLVVLEYFTVIRGLRLTADTEYGVLSYGDAEASGPPLMVLVVAAALLVAGVVVWRRQKWVWLFVGTALMTFGSAVSLPVESGAITNAFELVLLISILATKSRQDSAPERERSDGRERRGVAQSAD